MIGVLRRPRATSYLGKGSPVLFQSRGCRQVEAVIFVHGRGQVCFVTCLQCSVCW
jgi:hypothetical protein